jgi:hypothetical protein
MKKFLLAAICVLAALSVYAQNAESLPRTYLDSFLLKEFYHRQFILPDSLKDKLFQKKNFLEDRGEPKIEKFLYNGNNNKGFEIWQSIADNLYILKPDSTFLSNMPVLKTPLVNDNMVERK